MYIRLATEKDASELYRLNELFNGTMNVTAEAISNSITNNAQEKSYAMEVVR